MTLLAGAQVAFAPELPLELGQPPLTKARRLIARALLARSPRRPEFFKPVTEFEAAHTIDAAFNAEIDKALAPLDDVRWPIAVKTFHAEDGSVTLLVIPQDAQNLAPAWTTNPKVRGAVKQAVWRTIGDAVPAILPMGDFAYLMEEASGYYWDGATDDAEALAAAEDMGHDKDDILLPSHIRKAVPRWVDAKYKRGRRLPREIALAIALVKRRLKAFKKLPARHSAWRPDWNIASEHDPSYQDCASTPPFFLVPLVQPILDMLDMIADGAMQVGFFDVAGAITLTKPSEINHWLESFAAGIKLLAAIDRLLQASPFRKSDV